MRTVYTRQVIALGEMEPDNSESSYDEQKIYCIYCNKKTRHRIYSILLSECLECHEMRFQQPLP